MMVGEPKSPLKRNLNLIRKIFIEFVTKLHGVFKRDRSHFRVSLLVLQGRHVRHAPLPRSILISFASLFKPTADDCHSESTGILTTSEGSMRFVREAGESEEWRPERTGAGKSVVWIIPRPQPYRCSPTNDGFDGTMDVSGVFKRD
ncbi:hypothetical protein QR680_018903 [Steinernema hermaphroditum]|uniref:Uncharacterized protein n=1 Tax=Steinernema hermaphroditum TaxID=289476 RepID=A0AA39HJD6_9BILA|nr:hypothetical protein QR680_018903 [Steinernema hermaphroditum]